MQMIVDTKLYREIKTIEDQRILQKDLDTLTKWSEIWLLKFHPEKCFKLTIIIITLFHTCYTCLSTVHYKLTCIHLYKIYKLQY